MNALLIDRLTCARGDFRRAARVLRRARRLYIRFVREAVLSDETGSVITRCAERMIDCGLYAPITPLREARFRILRELCRQDGCWHHWHRWYMERGFARLTFEKEKRRAA